MSVRSPQVQPESSVELIKAKNFRTYYCARIYVVTKKLLQNLLTHDARQNNTPKNCQHQHT